MTRWINVGLASLVVALVSPPFFGAIEASTADSVTSARELYAAADYEEALSVLERLQAAGSLGDPRSAAEVRAYCLLALGRAAAAREAITEIVSADPLYHPSGAEASPSVRSAFAEVRRRLLPDMIQSQYANAKARFDAKDFAGARDAFTLMLYLLAEEDVADAAARPPLSDLRTLAAGFRELSATAVVPAPIESRVQPLAMTVIAAPPRVYSAQDEGVSPPVALRQAVPLFPLQGPPPAPGSLELLIDEQGSVEHAMVRATITPKFDQLLLTATRDWRYSPAILEGRPVKYRKVVQIAVTAK